MSGPAVLLDIEGTIAPIAFVYDVLFPYARRELPTFLAEHWYEPAVAAGRAQVAKDAGVADFTRGELTPHLHDLMDRDVKATGLKALQGLVWERGYASGALRSEVFDDVPPALRRWRSAGTDVAIYSSGSVAAQRVFLAHTQFGDLTPHIGAYFDTTTGPKRDAPSYAEIARQLERRPAEITFHSDAPAELAAARDAGMAAVLVVRPGNNPVDKSDFRIIRTFDAEAATS